MDAAPFKWLLFLISAITTVTRSDTTLGTGTPVNWSTPRTPNASEVNCHIEIKSKRFVGGRCIRFGRNSTVGRVSCQSGVHVQFGNPECEQSATRSPRQPLHRNRRNRNGNAAVPSQNGTNVSDILSRLPQLSHTDLLQYTPRVPSPENVNCHVEVPVTQTIGGRCVVLGNQMVGCQAGMYLAFSSECEGIDGGSNRRRSAPSPRARTSRPNRSRP